jgi:predicted transcriptional regulator
LTTAAGTVKPKRGNGPDSRRDLGEQAAVRYGFDGNREVMKPSVLTYSRALACESRLFLLQAMGETGMSVTALASSTGISTSTTCFHLAELVRVGLVVRKRKGRCSIYRWSDTRLSFHVEQAPLPPSRAS